MMSKSQKQACTGARALSLIQKAGLLAASCAALASATAAEPQAFTVAQTPLFLSAPAPNVLLLLDNSNSFDERPDGTPVGSNHNASKSVIAREALRGIVDNYVGQINMGLMAYKAGTVSSLNVSPTSYDSSFDSSSYDPSFTDALAAANNWESFPFVSWGVSPYGASYASPLTCAAPYSCAYTFATPYAYTGISWSGSVRTGERRGKSIQYQNLANTSPWYLHPYDFVYYNLMQASYSGSYSGYTLPPTLFCYSQNTLGLHGNATGHPTSSNGNQYTCYNTKAAPASGFKPDGSHNATGLITDPTFNNGSGNVGSYGFGTKVMTPTYVATDSDQAQGFTTFGRIIVDYGNALAANDIPAAPTYYQDGTPGYGALKYPIQPLTLAQASALDNLLQCNIPSTWQGGGSYTAPANTTACASTGIKNAGATPSAGALRSASRYFQGTLTASENDTGITTSVLNTTGAAANNLPNSCGKNYVIFVTDGMPSHDANGNLYSSPAAALADTVAQAQALQTAGTLVYVIGFGAAVQQSGLDQIAAAGGTGASVVATDAATLNAALSYVFNDVIVRSASAASVATNSAQFSVDTAIYQARFTSADWSGQLLRFQTSNTTGAVAASYDWDAGQALMTQVGSSGWSTASSAANRRQIIMGARPGAGDAAGNSKGVRFLWPATPATPTATEMFSWQSAALNKNQANTADAQGPLRVNWVRGDQSNEGAAAPRFRQRNLTVLGDLVNSYPLYITAPHSTVTDNTYAAFKTAYATRRPVIAVGGNDGMLHLFDTTNGEEVFAYIPSNAFLGNPSASSAGPRLSQLMRQDYKSNHTYIVDGTPVSDDVYYGGAWHTVVVAGAGAGGSNIFALNITNTSNVATKPDPALTEANAATVALWEFTDKNVNSGTLSASGVPTGVVNGDPDMGYSIPKPLIAKAKNGKWVAIFGNGYNNSLADGSASTTGYGALYVVDIQTGSLIRKISVPVGTVAVPNGVGSPRGLDSTLTGITDMVYAGDLYGNLWKFDLSNADPAQWEIAYSGSPLFTINNIGGTLANRRPITGELKITMNPAGGYMILFGSGRYLASGAADLPSSYDSSSVDALYSVWDMGSRVTGGTGGVGRSWLKGQSLQNATLSSGNTYRQLSSTATTMCSYGNTPATQAGCTMGCYIDLKDFPTAGNDGERFTYFPQLTSGAASFNTIVPSTNICAAGGNTEQVIFDYLTCSAIPNSPFDVNGDLNFTSADLIAFGGGTAAPAGSKVLIGITPPGTRVYNPNNGQIYVYNSSSLGGNPVQDRLKLGGASGRVSWREVRPAQ